MKTLIVGDTHFANHQAMGGPVVRGVNRRCRELVETLVRIVRESECQRVIQLGDFFDNPRQPASVVDYVIESLLPLGVEWHIMAGNHDIASFSAPSAIAPLRHVRGLYVHESIEKLDDDYVLVPYTSLGVAESIKRLPHANHVLMHYGLCNGPWSFDYANAHEVRRRDTSKCAHFICGHEHTPQVHAFETAHALVGAMSDLNFGDIHTHYRLHGIGYRRLSSSYVDFRVHEYGPEFCAVTHAQELRLLLMRIGNSDKSLYVRTTPQLEPTIKKLVDVGIFTDYTVQYTEVVEPASEELVRAVERIDEMLYTHLREKYEPDVAELAVCQLQDVLAKVKL